MGVGRLFKLTLQIDRLKHAIRTGDRDDRGDSWNELNHDDDGKVDIGDFAKLLDQELG